MEVLYPRCAGLDVHKDTVVACLRLAAEGATRSEVRTFDTTTPDLLALADWLIECGCTHVAMEATGVYSKPVWHVLSDGDMTLILANAAHVKNVPGRKTDMADATWLADLLAHGLIRASCRSRARNRQSGFGPTTFQWWRSKNFARSSSFIACRSASSSMRPPAAAGV